jgi:hypothetical protein
VGFQLIFDRQGLLGDCYFLSSLAVLAQRPSLIRCLFLTDTFNASGVVGARFCKHGEWHDIIVDDRFPCSVDETYRDESLDAVSSARSLARSLAYTDPLQL